MIGFLIGGRPTATRCMDKPVEYIIDRFDSFLAGKPARAQPLRTGWPAVHQPEPTPIDCVPAVHRWVPPWFMSFRAYSVRTPPCSGF